MPDIGIRKTEYFVFVQVFHPRKPERNRGRVDKPAVEIVKQDFVSPSIEYSQLRFLSRGQRHMVYMVVFLRPATEPVYFSAGVTVEVENKNCLRPLLVHDDDPVVGHQQLVYIAYGLPGCPQRHISVIGDKIGRRGFGLLGQ